MREQMIQQMEMCLGRDWWLNAELNPNSVPLHKLSIQDLVRMFFQAARAVETVGAGWGACRG